MEDRKVSCGAPFAGIKIEVRVGRPFMGAKLRVRVGRPFMGRQDDESGFGRSALLLLPKVEMARPRRLDRNLYVGFQIYFVTSCTLDREKAFCDHDFCLVTRHALFADAAEHNFSITTYCFMPDHVHLLLRAKQETAVLPSFVAEWKQHAGFAWRQRRGRRLWQEGYWDRILRAEDEVLPIARYIAENPPRAGLVSDPRAYPWMGSEEYSIEQILDAAQIDLWKKWSR